ncbi:WW domain containing protein [Trichomonas vaginalis G3]|uniref:WW domain containing protein n=1 Tax=Trichomonas vaginalis (strain ATCC PRA-98 / G3) TaxID=412133 RepID=A2DT87_TRIV3|nr:hypothetical protein TVAGG3_0968350 [Trichomonas vaginalis G3]EAY16359.1 WW domain containing protein [Trichomonas vaginalis G3]KAI5488411.1 hypothetical protein TVAGG3_0968350 [Trichomonas vaginalis G3]|eukprot:XP_001328582.1 WW domain containing protein [Trichomonas vaginalis G3]
MNGSFVEIDDPADTYVPKESEIEEFAKWLGAQLPRDKSLLWIAKEALTAKIPPPWKYYQRKDGTGEPFYFNPLTGESLWDHPLDKQYKQLFQQEQKKLLASMNPPSALKQSPNDTKPNSENTKPSNIDEIDLPKAQISPPKIKEKLQQQEKEIEPQISKGKLREVFHDEIEEMISNHEDEIQQLKEDFQTKYEIMRNRLQAEYDDRIKQEKAKYDAEIEKIQNLNKSELTSLQQQQIAGKKESFKVQMETLEKNNELELEKKKLELQTKLTQLETENMTQIAQMKINQQQEITEILTSHQTQLSKLKSKLSREVEIIRRKARAKMDAIRDSKEIQFLQEEMEMKKKELIEKNELEIKRMTKKHEANKKLLQEKFNGEIVDMQSYQQMSPFKDDNIIKQIKSDLEDDKNLRMALDTKKAKILNQFKAEIDELKEKHEDEIKQLNSQHLKLTESIKNEIAELKREADQEKIELKEKRKNEIQKIKDECDMQIMQLREELLTRKQIEKTQFSQDMQLMLTMLENEKMRAEQQKRAEIEEIKRRVVTYQPEKIFVKEEKRVIPFLSIAYQNEIDIMPKSEIKYQIPLRFTFSSQKVFSRNQNAQKPLLDQSTSPSSKNERKSPDKSNNTENTRKSSYIESYDKPETFSYVKNNRISKQRKTLSKIEDQFNSEFSTLDQSSNAFKLETDNLTSSFQNLINSQTREMTSLSSEFNKTAQKIQITMTNALSSLENQFSILNNKQPIQIMQPAPPQIPIEDSESFSRSSFIIPASSKPKNNGRSSRNRKTPRREYDDDDISTEASDLSFVVGHNSAKLLRMFRQQRKQRAVQRIK